MLGQVNLAHRPGTRRRFNRYRPSSRNCCRALTASPSAVPSLNDPYAAMPTPRNTARRVTSTFQTNRSRAAADLPVQTATSIPTRTATTPAVIARSRRHVFGAKIP